MIDIDKFHRMLVYRHLIDSEFIEYLIDVHDAMGFQEKIDRDNKITISFDDNEIILTEHGNFYSNDFSGYEYDKNEHYIPLHILESKYPIWEAKDYMLGIRLTIVNNSIADLELKRANIDEQISRKMLKASNIRQSIQQHNQHKPS